MRRRRKNVNPSSERNQKIRDFFLNKEEKIKILEKADFNLNSRRQTGIVIKDPYLLETKLTPTDVREIMFYQQKSKVDAIIAVQPTYELKNKEITDLLKKFHPDKRGSEVDFLKDSLYQYLIKKRQNLKGVIQY